MKNTTEARLKTLTADQDPSTTLEQRLAEIEWQMAKVKCEDGLNDYEIWNWAHDIEVRAAKARRTVLWYLAGYAAPDAGDDILQEWDELRNEAADCIWSNLTGSTTPTSDEIPEGVSHNMDGKRIWAPTRLERR